LGRSGRYDQSGLLKPHLICCKANKALVAKERYGSVIVREHMKHSILNRTLFLVASLLVDFGSFAQVKELEVKAADFELTSPYYLNNIDLKFRIFKYLNNTEIRITPIEEILTEECFQTEQKVFPSRDTTAVVATLLNTLGNLTYCITGITKSGDINYRKTYSSNLNITIDKGTLKK
jgi:hypothetical protein